MNTSNGWNVYMRIKELQQGRGDAAEQELHIDDLVKELAITKELLREYLTALFVLKFIEFTDRSKDTFVLTDQG